MASVVLGKAKFRSNLLKNVKLTRIRVGMFHDRFCEKKSKLSLIFSLQRFSDVFFIDASSLETITADLKNIARAKGVGDSAEDTLQWLSRLNEEWLLLFNNADDTTLNLRNFFPLCSHGNIIVTSRNSAARIYSPDLRSESKVSRLTPDDAIDLLFRIARVTPEQSGQTRMLAESIVEVCFSSFFSLPTPG
jgi:hypothetical protein